MEIDKPNLHVAFGLSIAGSVSRALRSVGRDERAIGLIDDLSFGPIDSATPVSRAEWIENVVGVEFLEVVQRAELFWCEVVEWNNPLIAWVCFDDAAEYCGFLEFVQRVGDAPFRIIDATGFELTENSDRKWMPRTLGVITSEKMVESGLIDRAMPLRREAIASYRQRWSRLRAENAPLRIVGPTGLISAPITYFDYWLTRQATNEWKMGARIVGQAMGEIWETGASPHVSDIWLWGRICALAREGVLEVEGDTSEMRSTRVRRGSAPT